MAVAPVKPAVITIQRQETHSPASTAASQTYFVLLGIGVLLTALGGLVAWEYRMPDHFRSVFFGIDMMGVWHFADHLGLSSTSPLPLPQFRDGLRGWICLLWLGYGLAMVGGMRGGKLPFKPLIALIIAVAAIMAVFCAPLFSADVYAYLGYGRLAAIYGQNPYVVRPQYLFHQNDPASHFLFWNIQTIYGPVWTRLTMALVALHPHSIWREAVELKLVGAVAVILMALAGRGIARHYAPGRENLTLLAIGLNPLLLIEGPGSAHNDLLLIAFLMLGAMFFLDGKYLLASLFLGLSVGIKLITLAALPWMLLDACRNHTPKQRLGLILSMTALVLLPTVVCYGRFWVGTETLAALQERSTWGLSAASRGWRHALVADVYLALTVWLWRRPASGAWLTAWSLLAAAATFIAFAPAYPWYFVWFLPMLLTRWDKAHLSLSAACFGLGMLWDCGYASLVPLP